MQSEVRTAITSKLDEAKLGLLCRQMQVRQVKAFHADCTTRQATFSALTGLSGHIPATNHAYFVFIVGQVAISGRKETRKQRAKELAQSHPNIARWAYARLLAKVRKKTFVMCSEIFGLLCCNIKQKIPYPCLPPQWNRPSLTYNLAVLLYVRGYWHVSFTGPSTAPSHLATA